MGRRGSALTGVIVGVGLAVVGSTGFMLARSGRPGPLAVLQEAEETAMDVAQELVAPFIFEEEGCGGG